LSQGSQAEFTPALTLVLGPCSKPILATDPGRSITMAERKRMKFRLGLELQSDIPLHDG
jgi:hypothetical protein